MPTSKVLMAMSKVLMTKSKVINYKCYKPVKLGKFIEMQIQLMI